MNAGLDVARAEALVYDSYIGVNDMIVDSSSNEY
jgi:hypothetical protein